MKRTAFDLEKSLLGDKILIYSDKLYDAAGYKIKFYGELNYYTLEVIIQSIKPPKGPGFKNDVPASEYLFSTYTRSSRLEYDLKNKLLKGPQGAKIRIVLRDDNYSWGYMDVYELTL